MSAAVLGIYGNSKDEAIYPVYFVDDGKKPLSGANRYSLRFAPGQLPPVNAFWSLTLYELPSSLLSASHRELNRQGSRTMKASSLVISIALSGTVAVVGQAHAQSPSGDPISVTVDNFIRAESDLYLGNITKDGGFGKFNHRREPATIENQTVIRLNRDTLYSAAVFDLDAGPVTITLPDTGNGFMSMQVIDEDHCELAVFYGAGSHTLTRDQIGTRYMAVAIRTLVDPADPKDIGEVHALQDAIKVSRKSPGKFEIPNWDPASQKKLRDALLVLGSTLPDFRKAFGTKEQVDPIRHLIGSAAAWGGNPRQGCDLSQHHPR